MKISKLRFQTIIRLKVPFQNKIEKFGPGIFFYCNYIFTHMFFLFILISFKLIYKFIDHLPRSSFLLVEIRWLESAEVN